MQPLTERQFQNQVVTLAKYCGWKVYHTLNSRGSEAGFPDLVLVRGERLVFAELKSSKGRLSPAQKEWLNALDKTSCESYVWFPSDWTEIEGILQISHDV